MGYDVHITRAESWSESEDDPISAEEWEAYAASDPTLRREGSDYFFNWRVGDIETWLDWIDGVIYTKNPPQEVRAAMFAVATALAARVQGDEGEWYGADGNVIADENFDEEGRPRPEARAEAEPWTAEEIAEQIAEIEEFRRRGELDDWLFSFEGILDGFPPEVRRYVESTPEFKARRRGGFFGRIRGRWRS